VRGQGYVIKDNKEEEKNLFLFIFIYFYYFLFLSRRRKQLTEEWVSEVNKI